MYFAIYESMQSYDKKKLTIEKIDLSQNFQQTILVWLCSSIIQLIVVFIF